MTNQLSWINETKEQNEEVIQPILSINHSFDFQEKNNEDLLDYFISELDISEQLRNMQYIVADQVLVQNVQENYTIDSLQSSFDEICFMFIQ